MLLNVLQYRNVKGSYVALHEIVYRVFISLKSLEVSVIQWAAGHTRIRYFIKGRYKRNQEQIEINVRNVRNYPNYREQYFEVPLIESDGLKIFYYRLGPDLNPVLLKYGTILIFYTNNIKWNLIFEWK